MCGGSGMLTLFLQFGFLVINKLCLKVVEFYTASNIHNVEVVVA